MRAIQNGRQDYWFGKDYEENPYPQHSGEWHAWNFGWEEAQEHDCR